MTGETKGETKGKSNSSENIENTIGHTIWHTTEPVPNLAAVWHKLTDAERETIDAIMLRHCAPSRESIEAALRSDQINSTVPDHQETITHE